MGIRSEQTSCFSKTGFKSAPVMNLPGSEVSDAGFGRCSLWTASVAEFFLLSAARFSFPKLQLRFILQRLPYVLRFWFWKNTVTSGLYWASGERQRNFHCRHIWIHMRTAGACQGGGLAMLKCLTKHQFSQFFTCIMFKHVWPDKVNKVKSCKNPTDAFNSIIKPNNRKRFTL